MKRHELLSVMLAAAFLAGCPNVMLPTAGKRAPVGVKPSQSPSPLNGGEGLQPIPPGSLFPQPAPSASGAPPLVPTATLSGVVRVPAGLISNNGGNVVTNGGHQYRTLALTQTPLAGATVALVDAQRRPITGPDGLAIIAKADDQGRFGFSGALPTHNVMLEVSLPGEKGALMAIVPKDGVGPRVVDVELIGTLSTRYILDQYVRSQPDPQGTLDKLPGDVERDTRTKAAAAFEGAQTAVPEALTEAKVIETVTAMRQKDKAFHDQLEVVKRLLIAAGQSDLGNGRRGTEVSIGNVSALAVAPDGNVYFPTSSDNRVWRLSPDGVLYALVGGGAPTNSQGDAEIDGKLAAEAVIRLPKGVAIDPEGRLLIADRDLFTGARVSRLEPDGRFKLLKDQPAGESILAGPDGTVFAGSEFKRLSGRDAAGRLYYVEFPEAKNGTLTRVAPVTKQTETVLKRDETLTAFNVTQDAAIVTLRGGKLELTEPDGTKKVLLDDPAAIAAAGLNYISSAARGTDGTLYLASNGRSNSISRNGTWTDEKTPRMIWRVKAGQLSVVAGRVGAALVGASADDLALEAPRGLTFDTVGNLYVADERHHAVYKLSSERKVTAVLDVAYPLLMQADGTGNTYVLRRGTAQQAGTFEGREILKITPEGSTSTVHVSSATVYLYDFEVAPDGALYLLGADTETDMVTLYRKEGTAPPTELGTVRETGDRPTWPMHALALAPNGTLWIGGIGGSHLKEGKLWKWTQEQGLRLVKDGVTLQFSTTGGSNLGFAADTSGRVLWGSLTSVVRFDPATGTTEVLAGEGGRLFTGTGADESVGECAQPAFDAAGDLFFIDGSHKQIKRIPKDKL